MSEAGEVDVGLEEPNTRSRGCIEIFQMGHKIQRMLSWHLGLC